jgi:hypothetical protein
MRTLIKALLPLCLLFTFAGAAAAQTPDGTPPAEETVCDAETGAAYGLCTAYCEAMDCESDAPSASATACGKVRSKFQNITGHDVPCEGPPVCPCTSIPQFNELIEAAAHCDPFGGGYALTDAVDDGSAFVRLSPETSCGIFFSFSPTPGFTRSITAEEAAVCVQLILDTATSKNLVCDR